MLPAFGQSKGSQKQNPPKDDGSLSATAKTIHVGVDIVLVNATVTDPYNRLVTGLDKEDFQVFEDGVPQEVAYLFQRRYSCFHRRDFRYERKHVRQSE